MCDPLPRPVIEKATPMVMQQKPEELRLDGNVRDPKPATPSLKDQHRAHLSFGLDGAMDDERLMAAGVPSSVELTEPPTFETCFNVLRLTEKKQSLKDRRSVARLSASREAHNLVLGFGEAFLDGQFKVSKKRGELESGKCIDGRRSARLQSTTVEEISPPEKTSPDSFKAAETGKMKTADKIAEEVTAAEERLQEMYKQRDIVVSKLQPGERGVVRHPKSSKYASKYEASVDEFGVAYTDLLAEHIKYSTKPGSPKSPEEDRARRPTGSPNSNGARCSKSLKKLREDVWCVCRGTDDNGDMIECANEKCLIGRFHLGCLGGEDVTNERWLCVNCKTALKAQNGELPPFLLTRPDVDRHFAPFTARAESFRSRCLQIVQSRDHLTKVSHSPSIDYSQLDGASDPPSVGYLPARPSPLRQTFFSGPASLLSSKHAPSADELLNVSSHRIEAASTEQGWETPGGPYSPGSTTSTGDWRFPPTRSQHLAAFVKPGNSLNDKEKATVELWRAASQDQLDWEKHMSKAEALREDFAALLEDYDAPVENQDAATEQLLRESFQEDKNTGDKGAKPFGSINKAPRNVDGLVAAAEVDESDLEAKVGLKKQRCHGRELSAVLAEVRTRRSE